jgi:hypothetical protein
MTANNQYFERNMLIKSKKTNTILESDDWGPKTELANINHFLDSSAATIDQQVIINNSITSLLGNNTSMETNLQNMNQKLDHQNSRPPGTGSNNLWFPTQLLMDMKKLLEEGNDIQEEKNDMDNTSVLFDISNNTGLLMPNILRDISNNTGSLKQAQIDNSKNLINLLNDTSGSNIDNSKNLINILNDLSKNTVDLYSLLGDVSRNLYDISENQPWLETISTTDSSINVILSNLISIDLSKNSTFNFGGTPAQQTFGSWNDVNAEVLLYPPKKFVLFVELAVDGSIYGLSPTEYIDFYTTFNPAEGWFLRDRFGYLDFNPGNLGPTSGATMNRQITRTYDWCGRYMRVYRSGATTKHVFAFARGI